MERGKENDILNLIQTLAQSQGFYGRLYARLMEIKAEDLASYREIMDEWESHNFKDDLDFIMYLEG